ncbi:MFS transporter [Streptomyces sp. NPDC058545]|uniref:MFS transporter n=1 Tax=Streptomyces sp. NPDC058545 TaxID=3346544 RepID=UPI0036667F5E
MTLAAGHSRQADQSATTPLPRVRNAAWVLAVCCAAQFLVVLDVTVVNIALPSIQADFHLSDGGRQWIINAYAVSFAGFLMLGARLGDKYGRRRVFMIGIALFTVFDVLGGLAPNGPWLIAARAGQGLGGAILAPATLSMLTVTFPQREERRRALGLWSTFAASGASAGLVTGGVLTQFLDWRWIFFIKVPVGLFLLMAAHLYVPADQRSTHRGRIDVAGALTITLGLGLAAYGIAEAGQQSWSSPVTLGAIAAGLACLALFILVEQRFAADPLVPLQIFRNRTLSVANGIAAIVGSALFGMYYFVSLYLREVNGYSALQSGFAFVPAGLATVAGALAGTRLVKRLGIRRQITLGLALAAAGLAWLSLTTPSAPYGAHILGPLILTGSGLGLSFVPTTQAGTENAPPQHAGLASGLITTTRQFGAAVGLAAMVTIAEANTSHSPSPGATALSNGYTSAFAVNAAILLAGVLLAQVLPAHTKQKTPAP